MFVSHKHKFLFFHVPKTAGSFIERQLALQLGEPNWKTEWACDEWNTKFSKNDSTYCKHMRPFRFQKKNPEIFKDYFKFAVVRNPWAWHLSFYSMVTQWEKFNSVEGHHAKSNGGRIHPLNDYGSFQRYITLSSQDIGPTEGGSHMSQINGSPCTRFLQNTPMPRPAEGEMKLLVPNVISFDSLQGGIDKCCKAIGIDSIDMNNRDSSTPEHRSEPQDCSSKHKHYSKEYTKEMANTVARLNYIDIKRFGWKWGEGK